MKKNLLALVLGIFMSMTGISAASPVAGWSAPFSAGFIDNVLFGQLEIGTAGVFGNDDIIVSEWYEFTGTNGVVSFAGPESQSVAGTLYSVEEYPIFQLLIRFKDTAGNFISFGLYDSSDFSWDPTNEMTYCTVGQFQTVSSVPEPASVMLMGAGLVMLALGRKRRHDHD